MQNPHFILKETWIVRLRVQLSPCYLIYKGGAFICVPLKAYNK